MHYRDQRLTMPANNLMNEIVILNELNSMNSVPDNILIREVRTTFFPACLVALACWIILCPGTAEGQSNDVPDLTLDSLLNVKISSAAKYDQTEREAPASVTIVTAEDIERYGYRTLDEVLMHVRGFYMSNDRNYSYVGARGFGRPTDYNDRILLLLNGHTLNENVYGSALIGSELGLSLDFIERIEIVRGPGSALYGNNAMFAVINLITKKGNLIDGGKFTMDVGSYGFRQGSARGGKEFDDGTDIAASVLWGELSGQDLYYDEYNVPSTNYGVAHGLDWDKPRGFVATFTKGDLSIQGMATSRKKGIPTGAFGVLFNDPSARTIDERLFVESRYRHALEPDKSIMVRGYYDMYRYTGTYPYDDGPQYDATDNLWLGSELQLIWDVEAGNRFTVGAEYRHNYVADYRIWNNNQTLFDQNFPLSTFSFYIQNELQLTENLSLTLGIRGDKTSGFGATVTPRGAVVYNPVHATTLKLLYGEAFSAPNIYEAHYEDAAARAKGNPGLKPERIRTLEMVWEHRITDELFGTVSAYNYRVTDLIDQIIDPSDSMFVFENISKAETRGIEFELGVRTHLGLHGLVSYSFQDAEDGVSKQRLTNSPAHVAKLGLAYQASRHISFALQIVNESGRKTLYGTQTSSVLLTDISVLIKPRLDNEEALLNLLSHMKCSFFVRNLFNARFETPGGLEHRQPAIQQNERNYSLKLEYAF